MKRLFAIIDIPMYISQTTKIIYNPSTEQAKYKPRLKIAYPKPIRNNFRTIFCISYTFLISIDGMDQIKNDCKLLSIVDQLSL